MRLTYLVLLALTAVVATANEGLAIEQALDTKVLALRGKDSHDTNKHSGDAAINKPKKPESKETEGEKGSKGKKPTPGKDGSGTRKKPDDKKPDEKKSDEKKPKEKKPEEVDRSRAIVN